MISITLQNKSGISLVNKFDYERLMIGFAAEKKTAFVTLSAF